MRKLVNSDIEEFKPDILKGKSGKMEGAGFYINSDTAL